MGNHQEVDVEPGLTVEDVLKALPVGYKFKPTDKELVVHYLMKKVSNSKYVPISIGQDIHASEFYSRPPHNLVSYSYGEREWFFFVYQDENYSSKKKKLRTIRDGKGFWKSNGEEYSIFDSDGNVMAFKLNFTYFKGNLQKAKKTHWRMKEYRMKESQKEEWVLSKLNRGNDYNN
ncbi:NAC domain [Quillaja saponaria]|uniref:NAC domain n=1 Tax=Quillaja saponaria TaxID=32244 RepID=A0AAD7LEE0_QUISA|nr:NAC domain [Quillaja saponaria]